MKGLKPCPFCGSPASIECRLSGFNIYCTGKPWDCSVSTGWVRSEAQAISIWNRRAVEYHDDADLLTWVNTWLDSARFDKDLTEEEQDACWIVLSAVARLQGERE